MKIAIIGARAGGKTTIGRLLALARHVEFVDLDDVTLERTGETSIRALFAKRGEAAWRAHELRALGDVIARRDPLVIALGGGTPVIPAARAMLDAERRAGRLRVVYLRSSAAELTRRLRANPGDRPALTAEGADPADEIAQVLGEREPIYLALADVVCDGERSADQVLEELKRALDSK